LRFISLHYVIARCHEQQGRTVVEQPSTRISPVDVDQKWAGLVAHTIGTVNAHFMRNWPNAWADGITLIDVRRDGKFNVHILPTVDGQFSFAGETYGRKTRKAA
jgi:hypothetical protein